MTQPDGPHVVVCGRDSLTLRVVEELVRWGERVVLVTSSEDGDYHSRLEKACTTLVRGNYRDELTLLSAGVASVRAVILAEDDDVGNLHAALAIQDVNPEARIVLRMFNLELGRRIQSLFRDAVALSSSALAAPVFVAAALGEEAAQVVEVAGKLLAVRRGDTRGPDVLLALESEPNPEGLYLADIGSERGTSPGTGVRNPRWSVAATTLRLMLSRSGPRLRFMGLLLLLMAVVSSLIFHFFAGLDPIDAVYFTVTIITTTGFGDINLRDADPALKLYGAALMLFGAAALAMLYALIADAMVEIRLEQALGARVRSMRGHIVVCGLGNLGFRVTEYLARMDVPVIAVEIRETSRRVPAARSLGVPVMVGDASVPETLRLTSVSEARCLIACTDDDAANIEAAVNGRALNPELRIVLRLFDPDFAARVERAFGVRSKSVSQLAAPAFAAAATGRRVAATIVSGNELLVVAETRLETGCPGTSHTVRSFEQATGARVLATREGERYLWRPPAEHDLAEARELAVVVPRARLAAVLAMTERTRGEGSA